MLMANKLECCKNFQASLIFVGKVWSLAIVWYSKVLHFDSPQAYYLFVMNFRNTKKFVTLVLVFNVTNHFNLWRGQISWSICTCKLFKPSNNFLKGWGSPPPLLGKLPQLFSNICMAGKAERVKLSSLFNHAVSDEEKKVLNPDIQVSML